MKARTGVKFSMQMKKNQTYLCENKIKKSQPKNPRVLSEYNF